MPDGPQKYIVSQGWPLFLLTRIPFVLIVVLPALSIGDPNQSVDLVFSLMAAGVFCVFWYSKGAGVFVRIDDAGLFWWSSGLGRIDVRSLDWHNIEACACKNEKGRRILRLFFRRPESPRSASRSRLVRRLSSFTKSLGFPKGDHIDIDFKLAHEPEISLEHAFRSCVEWIAAKRGHASTGPLIRDFDGDSVPEIATSDKASQPVAPAK